MDKPESFEVQEYGGVTEPYLTFQTIKQIVQDRKDMPHSPVAGFQVDFLGDIMKVRLMMYEMHLPSRMNEIKETASKLHKSYLSELKKEFKKRAKRDLKLKEIKDKADYTIQKVSLNERYYYMEWRLYEMDV